MRQRLPREVQKRLAWPLRLTRAGMAAERALAAFWPLLTLAMALGAVLLGGLADLLPAQVLQGGALAALAALGGLALLGARRFRFPSRRAALARLDATLQAAPLAALADETSIGRDDAGTQALWEAHRASARARLEGLKAPRPDLRIAARDPYALRHIATLALVTAAAFGSLGQIASVGGLLPGTQAEAAAGASWEGWIQPPAHTGEPSLYLADQPEGPLAVPVGSLVTLRFYGQLGAVGLEESVSGDAEAREPQPGHDFAIAHNGEIAITGPGGMAWSVTAIGDLAPAIRPDGDPERTLAGDVSLPFRATDDYAITSGQARLSLDLAAVDRRYGLAAEPDARADIVVDLPMPFRGDRKEVAEVLRENLAPHPWAELPVTLTLTAYDATGQSGSSAPLAMTLPGRRFLDPMAMAIVEQRRDLLWSRDNGARVARLLRAVSTRPDEVFEREILYLRLRILTRRLEGGLAEGLPEAERDRIAQGLWDLAVAIEDGVLTDAYERLQRAQERLQEAIEQGASPEELAELMQEMRDAMRDYLDELAQRGQKPGADEPQASPDEQMTLTDEDFAEMMDRIEQAMREGRMDEAMAMLQALEQMMQNLEPGQQQQAGEGRNPGAQAMEGLRDTLREQQGLSDEAFRDLQEQRNPGAQAGRSQGNTGRDGGEGRGQSHDPSQGQGKGTGEGEGADQRPGQGREGGDGVDLSERQRALAEELQRQRNGLPGAGSQAGEAARDALDRAGRAMDGAAQDLAEGNLSQALDGQARAMEALREGMRNLDEALAQMQQENQPGQQGSARGQPGERGQNDPLGRGANNSGGLATEAPLAEGEDPYRRAEELTEELRRRAGEAERPGAEIDYLKRLLERF